MTTPEPTGIDLARVALQAAKAAAQQRGTSTSRHRARRTRTAPGRGAGRDPVGLGAAISGLIAAHGWATPVASGGLVDQWPALAPEIVAHVTVLSVDEANATLELLADSPAYATQARLMQSVLLQRITQAAGPEAVRTIKIHQPGSTTRTPALSTGGVTGEPPQPFSVRSEPPATPRREDPAEYRRARAALREAGRTAVLPGIQQETGRRAAEQDAALRAHREPEGAFADGQAALKAARPRTGTSSDDARLRALAYKRAERSGALPACGQARMDRSA
ncbi:DUF721 domain-containing protein [Actinacidiphila glaucinigra]|uniref:DUF721 domain-containing protein n=1 Tax=Actinacidiphila glaucinigra TaxID=235986 RepID=UPI0033BEC510